MTYDELNDLLTCSRVPWGRIADAGFCLYDIAQTAGVHGDDVLRQRALRAARRRGRAAILAARERGHVVAP